MRTTGACALALIACAATAQAEDATTSNNAVALAAKTRLQNCQAARRNTSTWTAQEQARYRDMGCWQPITADNGARFRIDLGSIERLGSGAAIIIYQDEGGPFNPMNVQHWILTCEGHYRVMLDRGMSEPIYAPPLSVAGLISGVACTGAGVNR